MSKWSDEEVKYLKENWKIGDEKIGIELGRTRSDVERMRYQFGLIKKKRWTKKDEDFVRNNTHLSDREIAKELRRTIKSIRHKRHDFGLGKYKKKSYVVNKRFFNTWSSEMAYILGFIYADGGLDKNGYQFTITNTNLGILEDMKKIMDSNHPIPKRKKVDVYSLTIGSTKLYNKLVNLGLTPNKSLTMTFPNIPNEYFFAFVRGYFDGDGYVGYSESRSTFAVIFTSGSGDFLGSLQEDFK